MFPDKIYYEPDVLNYPLGQELKEKYAAVPWIEIESHNKIDELRSNENAQFANMKRHLIIGTRKTHKYVPNHKVSDFWFLTLLPDAVPCVCTVIWYAIIINVLTFDFL